MSVTTDSRRRLMMHPSVLGWSIGVVEARGREEWMGTDQDSLRALPSKFQ
jgi:hypothetical protein